MVLRQQNDKVEERRQQESEVINAATGVVNFIDCLGAVFMHAK